MLDKNHHEEQAPGMAKKFPEEMDIRLLVERKAGEKDFHTVMVAPDGAAALTGISLLIHDFAAITGIPVEGVLGRLAVVLLHPAMPGKVIPQ